jgi:hypothetical protein
MATFALAGLAGYQVSRSIFEELERGGISTMTDDMLSPLRLFGV